MKIEKDIPIPKKVRGRSLKYDFDAMEVGNSFFTAGDSRVQVSILTCAKRYIPKRFITQMAKQTTNKGRPSEKTVKGYRCWRVE